MQKPFRLMARRPRGLLPFAKEFLLAFGRRPSDVRVQAIADVHAGDVNKAQYPMIGGAVPPGDAEYVIETPRAKGLQTSLLTHVGCQVSL